MPPASAPLPNDIDVLIVGAGLSGIGMACRLKMACPDRAFHLVETRDRMGGTWDLFRYPGIRSDSDMYTLGYPFRPWPKDEPIGEGPEIRRYVEETARDYGVDEKITYGATVTDAAWDSSTQKWTVTLTHQGAQTRLTCRFLIACAGYYDYDEGYTPTFEGTESFKGQIIHPQHWPEALELDGRRPVVIGSGATAVTLVPALVEKGAHVTMLQRSPSYVVAMPKTDVFARRVRKLLPEGAARQVIRWRSILIGIAQYAFARKAPALAKKHLTEAAAEQLGNDAEAVRHFVPDYNVWDQRVCLDPDGKLFKAIKSRCARMVTGQIDHFDEDGLVLVDGRHLDTDLVITATGLNIRIFGGIRFTVDDDDVSIPDRLIYKGMMVEGLPNFGFCFGYTNASWTLKADLSARHLCRILKVMATSGRTVATPVYGEASRETVPLIDFSSGYITRAADIMPKQGTRAPWRVHQNYLVDLAGYRLGKVEDGTLAFKAPPARAETS